jgi:nickel transport protein
MRTLFFLLCCWATFAQAHEVHHRIAASGAVVISISYADGKPFAYEKYMLYPAGQETPQQVGNTDAAGRVVFLPGTTKDWRLQATSADGHGTNLEFAAPETGAPAGTAAAETTPRWLLAGFGLSLIFGLFGLFQLFMRKTP